MIKLDYICKGIYCYFFEKVYRTACSLMWSDKAEQAVEDFIIRIEKEYGKSVGAQFVWDYTLYQFSRYLEKIKKGSVGFSGKITPIIVFGKRPHEVYKNRRQEMDWISTESDLVLKYKVSKEECRVVKGIEFKVIVPVTKSKKRLNDPIKKIASSGDNPLDTCIDMTDLYHPFDVSCKKCLMKEECWQKLEQLYPKVFKERSTL